MVEDVQRVHPEDDPAPGRDLRRAGPARSNFNDALDAAGGDRVTFDTHTTLAPGRITCSRANPPWSSRSSPATRAIPNTTSACCAESPFALQEKSVNSTGGSRENT